ncbi:MAG: hypothetical protein VB138_04015, partial [Burkholderia sp.]
LLTGASPRTVARKRHRAAADLCNNASLSDKKQPPDIERARAVADIAQVIINSAKVEVEHLKVVGGKGTGFVNGPGSTTHRLGG